GLLFLHRSPLGSHGNLKLSNCLMEGRMQVKLSGFGLWELQHGWTYRTYDEETTDLLALTFDSLGFAEFYWMAPQLLWLPQVPWSGSPKGDAYSFAVLMREPIHHQDLGPFDDQNLTPAGPHGLRATLTFPVGGEGK
ncbi:hypothetical protein Celaphus_00008694, partial [Cervus elaphus hippelaphus]